MSRVRVAFGLLAVSLGTAWWAGALVMLVESTLAAAPVVLVIAAVVGAVRALAPPWALVGPAVLLLVGTGWLILRNDLLPLADPNAVFGVVLVVVGCAVALSERRPRWRPGLVRRCIAVLGRRRLTITGDAPARLAVTAILGSVTVDLREAGFPGGFTAVEVDLTVLAGRVDLLLSPRWRVGPGRIVERALHLEGTLDWLTPVVSVADLPSGFHPNAVVINLTGFLGSVSLPQRSPAPVPPAPPG